MAVIAPGVQILEEEWLTPGQPDYYRRFLVQCPHHVGGPRPCNKSRNCGQGQTSRFGDMEPAGFLAAWVRSGELYATREEHMARAAQPTQAEVEAAMRDEGWM